jgi:hypothetical protein
VGNMREKGGEEGKTRDGKEEKKEIGRKGKRNVLQYRKTSDTLH